MYKENIDNKEEIIENKVFNFLNLDKTPSAKKIEGKIFSKCKFYNFDGVLFLSDVKFNDCTFEDCNIQCVAKDIVMNNCTVLRCIMTKSSIRHPKIEFCEISFFSLTQSILTDVYFNENITFNSFVTKTYFYLNTFYESRFSDLFMTYCSFYKCFFHENKIKEDLKNRLYNNFFDAKSDFYKVNFKNIKDNYNQNNRNSIYATFYRCENKSNLGITSPCPAEGSFIGYKKCRCYSEKEFTTCILTLEICADAKRIGHNSSGKCRCSKANVLKAETIDGEIVDTKKNKIVSMWDDSFVYKAGETVFPDEFDESQDTECGNGIHFFMTKEEAIAYYD